MSPEEKPPEEPDSDSLASRQSNSPEFESPKATDDLFADSSKSGQPDSGETNAKPFDAAILEVPAIGEAANDDVTDSADPVMAEIAGSDDPLRYIGVAAPNSSHFPSIPAPATVGNLENMSANGGAIGSLVLGVWCVAGSFITNWSIINGVIGLLMGFWGLTSRKKRTALIGIALCGIGIFMSLIQVSELINTYLNAVDETPY